MKTNPDKYCLIPIVENIQGKLHYIKVISITMVAIYIKSTTRFRLLDKQISTTTKRE